MNGNNPFGNSIDTSVKQAGDVLGGGGVRDSGVYDATIKQAYAGESTGGAKSMTFIFDTPTGDYRETVYVTSGRDKGQKNTYERNGQLSPLPGYTTANDIALLATGKGLVEQVFEEKLVKIYDFDAKAEIPQKVQVATSLIGKSVRLGIIRQTVDKNVKQGNNYVPSGETRDENNIDKVFHSPSNQTVSELTQSRDTSKAGEFIDGWKKKNDGVTRNKAKGAAGNTGAPGAPPTGGTSNPGSTAPLFGG